MERMAVLQCHEVFGLSYLLNARVAVLSATMPELFISENNFFFPTQNIALLSSSLYSRRKIRRRKKEKVIMKNRDISAPDSGSYYVVWYIDIFLSGH